MSIRIDPHTSAALRTQAAGLLTALCAPLLFIIFPFAACAQQAAGQGEYLSELIARANEQSLSSEEIWHRLVHYQKNLAFPGVHSLADDPNFFNSPEGKENPRAELEATLRGFFSDVVETEEIQHPQCAFPARYHWLDEHLHFDPVRMPRMPCKRFTEWRDALQPENITLVYPAAYLNNPASMFGHTLLRIDGSGQSEKTRLLAYGASYAAATEERSGMVFAVRGIFGGYKGVFSISPYYKQVERYSDLENRDIWEYELQFNAEQREQIVRHLWELGAVYFDYFFFDENCAYHLLSIFDAARPELKLTDEFPLWAIPSDTVRAVAHKQGLVTKTVYRPSNATIISARAAELPPEQRRMALRLASGELGASDESLSLPDEQRARVLELAFDYLTYQRLRGEEQGDDVPARGRNLLVARSKIKAEIPQFSTPQPAVKPEDGHDTARLLLGAGVEDGQVYDHIEYRPAYHDMMDPEPGYTPGAELRFFDLALRQYEGDDLKLYNFTPLGIRSISPRNEFFQPISWKIDFNLRRQSIPDRKHGILLAEAEGGPGLSYRPVDSALVYGLVAASAEYTTDYDDDFALGVVPEIGAYYDLSERLRMGIRGTSGHFIVGEEHREQQISAALRFSVNKSQSVVFTAAHRFELGDYENALQGAWEVYF